MLNEVLAIIFQVVFASITIDVSGRGLELLGRFIFIHSESSTE